MPSKSPEDPPKLPDDLLPLGTLIKSQTYLLSLLDFVAIFKA